MNLRIILSLVSLLMVSFCCTSQASSNNRKSNLRRPRRQTDLRPRPSIRPDPDVRPKPRRPIRPTNKPDPNDYDYDYDYNNYDEPLGDTVIIAVSVACGTVVLITIIIVLSVILYKRSRSRASTCRIDTENQLPTDNGTTGQVMEDKGTPDSPPTRHSVPNIYAKHGSLDEDESLYLTLEVPETVEPKDCSPLVKRSGPLPHRPTSMEDETPLTPPRPGVDDYYSYADVASMPSAKQNQTEVELKKSDTSDYYFEACSDYADTSN